MVYEILDIFLCHVFLFIDAYSIINATESHHIAIDSRYVSLYFHPSLYFSPSLNCKTTYPAIHPTILTYRPQLLLPTTPTDANKTKA